MLQYPPAITWSFRKSAWATQCFKLFGPLLIISDTIFWSLFAEDKVHYQWYTYCQLRGQTYNSRFSWTTEIANHQFICLVVVALRNLWVEHQFSVYRLYGILCIVVMLCNPIQEKILPAIGVLKRNQEREEENPKMLLLCYVQVDLCPLFENHGSIRAEHCTCISARPQQSRPLSFHQH